MTARSPADHRSADLLHDARALERGGNLRDAIERYEAAIAEAEVVDDARVLSEALRRLAVLRYQHEDDPDAARALCRRSIVVASRSKNELLEAEALNTLATVDLRTGDMVSARETYERSLALGGHDVELRARVKQNLGILANIHGDLDEAQAHYAGSLEAYDEARNEHGRAMAYHNLGMVSADRGLCDEADHYFERSRTIAGECGDQYLQALCLVNRAEVDVARQQYDRARVSVEAALGLFDRLDARAAKADAYRVIGVIYRETSRLALAESRLISARDLAVSARSVLFEAEASQELAVLYQIMGRNQEALTLLNAAHRLFHRLDARVDLGNVRGKVLALENTYLAVVRDWGQSIESSDSYTHGHCERVATYAVAVAQGLGLPEESLKTIRIGAYLHDVGKVRVPHEILNKAGPLTRDEFEIMQMHTVWGVELLNGIEFPWDIKPIIRSHHEKHDGTGYPDRLSGDEIPLGAQIIGIADVYDALTTTRSYRPAMERDRALAEIDRCRRHWREDVVAAFFASVGAADWVGEALSQQAA